MLLVLLYQTVERVEALRIATSTFHTESGQYEADRRSLAASLHACALNLPPGKAVYIGEVQSILLPIIVFILLPPFYRPF